MRQMFAVALVSALVGLAACAHSVVSDLDGLDATLTGISVMDMEHKSDLEVQSGRKYVCEARQAYAKGNIAEAKRLYGLAKEQADAAQMKQFGM
jgi:hypothetical protein